MLIIFGAVIASGINDTGAATSMVNFFIKKFKGKCLELAPSLTGFIMSIPVFGDIAIILNAPISAILAKRKKLGMQQVAPFVNLGLTLTHGLVPPTPGILAVSILLGADIGTVIIIGLICSVISFVVCYLGLRPVYAKGEYVAPLPQYTEGIEAVEDTNDVNALLIKEDNTPSAGASFLPLLLPAVMIAIGSIGKLFTAEGSAAYNFFNTFGNTVLALFMGIIAVGCLICGRKDKVVKKANADGTGCKLTEKSSWFEIVMNNWVGRALQIAIGALLITAMGGAMGGTSGGSYDVEGYITMPEGTFGSVAGKEIETLCADLPCEVTASGVMSGMMSYMTGSGVSLQVFGSDMADLQSSARTIARRLEQVEGVGEVSDGLDASAPALQVTIDRKAAAEKGLTVAQVYMQIAAALQSSASVSDVTLDSEDMDLTVDAAEGSVLKRENLLELELSAESSAASAMTGSASGMTGSASGMTGSSAAGQLTGDSEEDKTFKLGDVATVTETVSMNTISRDQQRRCVTVTAAIADGYNVTHVTSAAQQAVSGLTLPEGVTAEFNGENEQIMEAMSQLLLMLLLGVVLVYFIMVAQFQSLKSPFIVMFTIPLAFTGGFLALLIAGIEVSVISLIGFVMLVGIIVNNGIVLVDYINQQRLSGMERREAIIDAGVTRLRPILMTSLTTILGLIVTATAKNAGTALMQPIAVVCIGGLLYATLMTLFVVPCMYDMMNKKDMQKVDESELQIVDM